VEARRPSPCRATTIWPAKTYSFSRSQSARIRLSFKYCGERHCNHGGCYMIVTTLTTVLLHRFVMDHHKCRRSDPDAPLDASNIR
jgi:hypothetical protein